MSWLSSFFQQRKLNRARLRKVADDVGREIEQWPYDRFDRPAEELSFSRVIDGVRYHFSIEAYEENETGGRHVCIDVSADLPTGLAALPSYVFWKCPDGRVHYGRPDS